MNGFWGLMPSPDEAAEHAKFKPDGLAPWLVRMRGAVCGVLWIGARDGHLVMRGDLRPVGSTKDLDDVECMALSMSGEPVARLCLAPPLNIGDPCRIFRDAPARYLGYGIGMAVTVTHGDLLIGEARPATVGIEDAMLPDDASINAAACAIQYVKSGR